MDSLKQRGEIVGAFFSFLAVLIFALLCIFVKTEPKTVYKTIQVQLSSSKPNPEIQPKKAEVPVESKKIEKSENKKTETSSQKTQSAANTKKTESSSKKEQNETAKLERPKIRKSIEELMAEQNSLSSSKSAAKSDDWDDSVFDENAAVQSSASSSMPKIAGVKSSAFGSAGSAASASSSASASSKSSGEKKAASSSTKSALSELENLSFSSSNENNVKSMTQISAQKTGDGKLAIQMADGKLRELISPRKPVIYLDEIKVNLDKSKKVVISFDITESGTVPIGSIEISPASSLTDEIISLIKSEVATWTFSQGPEGSASFDYTIEIH